MTVKDSTADWEKENKRTAYQGSKNSILEERGIVAPVLDGRIPVFKATYGKNSKGPLITDYELAVDKNMYENAVQSDRKMPLLVSHMVSHLYDVEASKQINKRVMDLIYKDMNENYKPGSTTGRNLDIYVKIGPGETNKISKEIWPVLPPNIKSEILKNAEEVGAEPYIAVRRDMVYNYFGNREPSVVDLKWVDRAPAMVKHAIAMTELIIKELVSVSKVDIVIRTPAVIIGNILSNLMFNIMAGNGNIATVVSGQMKGVSELKKYIKLEKEHSELLIKKKAGKTTKAEDARIERLKLYMKRNSAAPLVKAGLYQAIADDVEMDEIQNQTYLGSKLDNVLKNAPGTKKLLDMLYITNRTQLFKVGVMATQYSDFAARYQRYYALKDKIGHEAAIKRVLDDFVNYNWADSKFLQWLNKVGVLMFTKFTVGMQRVLRQIASEKPLNVGLTAVSQGMFGDVDDVLDQSFMTKSWYGVTPKYTDLIGNVFTPTALEALDSAIKAAT